MKRLQNGFVRVFSCDVRALAAFRMALAVLLIVDIVMRARDLAVHYTDSGLMPRAALLDLHAHSAWLSLYLLNGTSIFTALLFALTAACAFLLLVGKRPRLMMIICWILLVSVQNRNPLVLQGGDILFRLLFFWAMFLPWNEATLPRKTVVSAATAALLLQLVLMYVFTGLLKSGPEWRTDLTAVYYTMRIDQMTTPIGHWLLNFPDFMKVATWTTWHLEVFGVLLFFIPWAPLRVILFFVFAGFQLSLGATLWISTFPWISITATLPFLPSGFWDWVERRRGRLLASVPEEVPSGPVWIGSRIGTTAVALLMALVINWNLSCLPHAEISVPSLVRWVGPLLRIDQCWDMFAPFPLKDDGWYVIPGMLRDKTEVDLFRDGKSPVSWEKPDWRSYEYKNQRWQKYMMNLWKRTNSSSRLYYGKHLCRSWNADHTGGETLKTLRIYFMREDTLPDGEAPPEKVLLWTHDCFKK